MEYLGGFLLKLIKPLVGDYLIAVSGGPDSMASLHYLSTRRDINIKGVIHYIHKDTYSLEVAELVREYVSTLNLNLFIGSSSITPTRNKEEYWRNERYEYFQDISLRFGGHIPIITGHNLDDALETYLMSFIKSGPTKTKVIPYERTNPYVIRPFLLTKKEELLNYNGFWDIPYMNDPCNKDTKYYRSRIRHELKPLILSMNPGIYKQIIKYYNN